MIESCLRWLIYQKHKIKDIRDWGNFMDISQQCNHMELNMQLSFILIQGNKDKWQHAEKERKWLLT